MLGALELWAALALQEGLLALRAQALEQQARVARARALREEVEGLLATRGRRLPVTMEATGQTGAQSGARTGLVPTRKS